MVSLSQLPLDEPAVRPWQPSYTLYGGAQRFSPQTPDKMLALAQRWLSDYPWLTETAKRRVAKRLSQPLEDLRIDFEDGYGRRSDEEEDAHAEAVGQALTQVGPTRRLGIRLKPLTRTWAARAARTLHQVLRPLKTWPAGFCLTLPKLEHPDQVRFVIQHLQQLEDDRTPIPLELMVESPLGLRQIPALLEAAGSRARGVHFGPYDYLASCGIHQGDKEHLVNCRARHQLLVAIAGQGLEVADGPTTVLPLPSSPSAQVSENHRAVRSAWELHKAQVLASRQQGFPQSWLLHPSQLVSHWAALIEECELSWPRALQRLQLYWSKQGQAGTSGSDFDDRATARLWTQVVLQALELDLLSIKELSLPSHWREI